MKRAQILLLVLALALPSEAHRDSARSHTYRKRFRATHPCPSTGKTAGRCPGYTVDHVNPLACGGPDDPANMQWQTNAAAKAKDQWENIGCRDGKRYAPAPPR